MRSRGRCLGFRVLVVGVLVAVELVSADPHLWNDSASRLPAVQLAASPIEEIPRYLAGDIPYAVSGDGSLVLLAGNQLLHADTGEVEPLEGFLGTARDMSRDGRYIAVYASRPLHFGETDEQLYRFDRVTGAVVLVADSTDLGLKRFWNIEMSDDGRYISYVNHDLRRGIEIARVSVATRAVRRFAAPVATHGYFQTMHLSGNGRYAIYWSSRFDSGVAIHAIGLYDFALGRDTFIREFRSGVGETVLDLPIAISASGRFLVADGFFFDRTTGAVAQFVSRVKPGVTPGNSGRGPSVRISDDGSIVAFISADALVPNDTNGQPDLYAWDRTQGVHKRLSRTDRGTQLDSEAFFVYMGGGAQRALFVTAAANALATTATTRGVKVLEALITSGPSPDIGVVDSALRPGGGRWTLHRSGKVTSTSIPAFDDCNMIESGTQRGDRPFLNDGENVTSLSPTQSGNGYWLFTDQGRVIPCGDAEHFGDLSGIKLDGPVIDSVATPTGRGYYMVAADGGLFTFGDAVFRGSVPQVLPGVKLAGPIVAITVTDSNKGYRMVAADGGMFSFGDATFHGSIPEVLPGVQLSGSIVAMVASSNGYLILGADGGIFNFGESIYLGSLGGQAIPRDITAVVVLADLSGYTMVDTDGTAYPFGTPVDNPT